MAPTMAQRRAQPLGERAYQAARAAKPFLDQSVIFYRGPSQLTGEPIIALAGKKTVNPKTGPVVQTWILRADMDPVTAVKTGADRAICGDCGHRGNGHGQERSCYVNLAFAPGNLYKSLPRAVTLSPSELADRIAGEHIRLGAYGDPVAVPMAVWLELLAQADGWTSYTHAWRRPEAQPYRAFTMASVDSQAEQLAAAGLGWRTFRVRTASSPLDVDEVVCPASEEAEHKATCQACNLCRGLARPAKSVAIVVHGHHALWFTSRAAIAARSPHEQ